MFYEMLSGQRPFDGDTPTSMIASIVKDTPRPVGELKPGIPRDVSRAVQRCLAKHPIDRYRTAIDLRHDLDDARQELHAGRSTQATTAARRRRLTPGVVLAAVGAMALIALVLVSLVPSNPLFRRRPDANVSTLVPRPGNTVQVTSSILVESYPTWSPDGQRLAFRQATRCTGLLGNHDIWVAQPGSDPVNLTNESLANDRRPSWSPDGREIAFYSDRDGEWGVWLVSAIGGTPRKLLPVTLGASGNAPQWSKDGRTLFITAREKDRNVVITLSLDSQETMRVLLPVHDSPQCWDLSVRPDGGRFAYVEAGGGNPEVGRLWTMAASGGPPIPLTDGRHQVWNPTWSADGNRLFYVTNRGGTWISGSKPWTRTETQLASHFL